MTTAPNPPLKYGIIGNPIAHSLSPIIHQLFAKQTNRSLIYDRFLIGEPDKGNAITPETLLTLIQKLQQQGYQGINVTLPFKEKVWTIFQIPSPQRKLTDRARTAGAVNTVVLQSELWIGDNTDGIGLIRDLAHQGFGNLEAQRILVLGAGGAVRGILLPLLASKPEQVTIANRTPTRALALANEFQRWGNVAACSLDNLEGQHFDLIINGINAHNTHHFPALPANLLPQQCYDLSYTPTPTPFLQWAQQQGARRLRDGKGMLVEQAAEAFLLWHQVRPATKPVLAQIAQAVPRGKIIPLKP